MHCSQFGTIFELFDFPHSDVQSETLSTFLEVLNQHSGVVGYWGKLWSFWIPFILPNDIIASNFLRDDFFRVHIDVINRQLSLLGLSLQPCDIICIWWIPGAVFWLHILLPGFSGFFNVRLYLFFQLLGSVLVDELNKVRLNFTEFRRSYFFCFWVQNQIIFFLILVENCFIIE